MEEEVRSLILDVVNERVRRVTSEKDLLQRILKGVTDSDFGNSACYETTWTLMLLASSPERQAKVRDEVVEVYSRQPLGANMIRKMKVLTTVINETLRLCPLVTIISREALADMKFGNMHVPKGINVCALAVSLHQNPEIWGRMQDSSIRRDSGAHAGFRTSSCLLGEKPVLGRTQDSHGDDRLEVSVVPVPKIHRHSSKQYEFQQMYQRIVEIISSILEDI